MKKPETVIPLNVHRSKAFGDLFVGLTAEKNILTLND